MYLVLGAFYIKV